MNWRTLGLSINRWLERLLFVWLLLSMGVGYLFHDVMQGWSGAVVPLFAVMTFVTALGTSFREFQYVARRPVILVAIFLLLHAVMPWLADGIAHTFIHQPEYVVGIVLASAIPVGLTSVLWTGMTNGDTALGLSLVSLDTLISPIVIPLTVRILLGRSVSMPFWTLFWALVWMVVLPTLIGLMINAFSRGRAKPAMQPVAGPLSKLAMLAVVAINVAVVTPSLSSHHGLGLVLAVLAGMAGIGYLFGFLAGIVGRVGPAAHVTMTYTVGMRNISAGIAIASQYFGHIVSIPVVLAMLFQQPFATLTYWLLRTRGRTETPESTMT